MSVHTLDRLLDQTRPAEPDDDGFTEIVMQGIRHGRFGRRTRRRFVTRPALLAAAAVLVTGGALAAAVRTTTLNPTQSPSPIAVATAAQHPRSVAASTPATGTKAAAGARPARVVRQAQASPTGNVARRFHNAMYEWGYTSPHRAYVLDKRSGLRVATETHSNSAIARRGRTITMTVTNTTDRPVAVSSRSGCTLSTAAWPGSLPDASASAAGRDPATAKYWECAGGGSARNAGGDEFILGPHASRTQTARLTLGAGRWAVAGICRCTVVAAPEPADGMTLGRLNDVVITTQGAPGEARLTTPPLAVIAR